jgi:uncharacterized protein YjbK
MSFQIIRIIKLIIIFSILGCSSSKPRFVSEVIVAIPVNEKFYYSEESDYKIKNQKYSLRYRAEYENGNLFSLKRYMPEGIIDYSLNELKADTAIISSLDIPFSQNWVINSDLTLMIRKSKKKLKQLDKIHFVEDTGRMIFLIKE